MEKISNQTFNIKLTVVTPTFIGAGEDKNWKSGMDYIQKGGKVYVLDIDKMVKNQLFDEKELTALLVKGEDLSSLIKSKPDDDLRRALRYQPFDSPVDKSDEIKSVIRSQFHDVPLIPGSSLKGAIRSVLFKYLYKKAEQEDRAKADGKKDEERKKKNETDVFGKLKNGGDFMRFIQIGDVEMTTPNESGNITVILNTKIFNLQNNEKSWRGGWKHAFTHTDKYFKAKGFNTLYECVAPGTSGSLVIALKQNAIGLLPPKDFILCKEAKESLLRDITVLFGIINEHTKAYLKKELDFFKKYNEADRTSEIIKNIEELIQRIPSDNSSCLLKMAAGSGFHSITGDWQYDDYDKTGFNGKTGKKKYKSRKIVEYNEKLSLMGFVELKVENN